MLYSGTTTCLTLPFHVLSNSIFIAADVREFEVSQWADSSTSRLQFSLLDFGNATHIFSMTATLAEGGSGDNTRQCTIAFIGTDEDIVLVSAPVKYAHLI